MYLLSEIMRAEKQFLTAYFRLKKLFFIFFISSTARYARINGRHLALNEKLLEEYGHCIASDIQESPLVVDFGCGTGETTRGKSDLYFRLVPSYWYSGLLKKRWFTKLLTFFAVVIQALWPQFLRAMNKNVQLKS